MVLRGAERSCGENVRGSINALIRCREFGKPPAYQAISNFDVNWNSVGDVQIYLRCSHYFPSRCIEVADLDMLRYLDFYRTGGLDSGVSCSKLASGLDEDQCGGYSGWDVNWRAKGAMFEIRKDDLSGGQTRSLLALHLAGMHDTSPPDNVSALDLTGLQAPEITVWTAWRDGQVASVGERSGVWRI